MMSRKLRARTGQIKDVLQTMPGIGPSLAEDLRDLGVQSLGDMARQSPEELYQRLCRLRRRMQDPCVLYAFRCARYYASRKRHDPKLLLWWNWKGRPSP
jgi:nucleotidyltransferase/DNA polymerase involved in DNA repair